MEKELKMYEETLPVDSLTEEEFKDLYYRYKNNNDKEAFNTIIKYNLRFVYSFVKKFYYCEYIMDFIQEGNCALFYALKKYDLSYDTDFSTYATYWIVSYINRFVARNSFIHLGINNTNDYKNFLNDKEKLESNMGKELSNEELSLLLNVPLDVINGYDIISKGPVSLEEIMDRDINSIYSREFEDYEECFDWDMIDENTSIDEDILKINDKDYFIDIVDKCCETDIQKYIILAHYGFIDGTKKTFFEIGEELGCSHQNVQQKNQKILRNIRRYLIRYNKDDLNMYIK